MASKKSGDEIKELENRLKTLKKEERGQSGGNPYLIPGAVLFAGILIAGSLFFSNSNNSSTPPVAGNNVAAPAAPPPFDPQVLENIRPVTAEDHIRGSIDAPVMIVEYSDTECPFCKRFHPTMQQVVDEYGDKVAWVYRHFPLDTIHSKARREAAATELAAELGGNDKFWEYIDRIFEITPSNDGLDLSLLPQIAEDVGLPRQPFQDLVDENDTRGGKYAQHIEDDYQDSTNVGGTGTPYSVIIAPNGKKFNVSGAQPFSALKVTIDLALKEI